MSPDVAIPAPSAKDDAHKKYGRGSLSIEGAYSQRPDLPTPQHLKTLPMDTLPTELHAYICLTASIDDGATIRSLNRVSKYFHEVSRPFLYHNVSAFGMDQVLALLERLERLPAQMRSIRHLFLSDASSEELKSGSKSSPTSEKPPPARLTDRQSQALARIIFLASPTLKSFSLVAHAPFSSTTLIARVFRTAFPHLQSLAISGFYPFPSSAGKFPALKHLRLSGNRNPHGLLHMCGLEETFPALATLTITGLGAAGGFVIELEEALTGGETLVQDGMGDLMAPTSLPNTLRSITLQAAPESVTVPVDAAHLDTVMMKDKILVSRLDALKLRKVKHTDDVQVMVLERSSTQISPDDMRRQWISEISR